MLKISFSFFLADTPKKRSNFLCSIICCLGKKRSSKHKDKESGAGSGPGGVIGNDTGDGGKASKAPVKALLPELRPEESDKKCIVIDLDETLVHSSFKVSLHQRVLLPPYLLMLSSEISFHPFPIFSAHQQR